MTNLKLETITVLDRIIVKLEITPELDSSEILKICNNEPKIAETICKILEVDEWIKVYWADQLNYPIKIKRSDSFLVKLANGNYAAKAEFEKESSEPLRIVNNITATNSNLAIGNTASVNQTINKIKIKKLIHKTIKETEQSKDITLVEKEEIIELLKDLSNSVQQGHEPPKSVLKRLTYFGEKVITVGASILTILSIILSK